MKKIELVKKYLKKLNEWKFIILIILLIGGSFYWFQIRPAAIYSKCAKKSFNWAKDKSYVTNADVELFYKLCVRGKGLSK